MKKINQILKEQIELIRPDKATLSNIQKITKEFCSELKKKLNKRKIKAEIFIGGSLAKNTLVKKNKYDVDIFVRFDNKYEDKKISKLLGSVLGKKSKKVHGSRDYYQISENGIIIEIIPVLKVSIPAKAQNITDLSYSHVSYILKKIKKNKRLSDEIMLAKTFCYAQNCYGAESYIHGFSGYALELLVCYYGNFLKFIKVVSKSNIKNKIIIDSAGFYKNKNEVLRELNKSKLDSPIIVIDPTFKERNALASLRNKTFLKFKSACLDFLRNPNAKFFEKKDIGEVLKKKYKEKLKRVSVKTTKQKGDIAGSKSEKFFRFFVHKLAREFKIKKSEFNYNEEKNIAYFYFVLDKKKDEIVKGPHVTKVEDLTGFKKKHKKAFIKNHFAYVQVQHNLSFEKFFNMFKKKYKKVIKEMDMKEIELVS